MPHQPISAGAQPEGGHALRSFAERVAGGTVAPPVLLAGGGSSRRYYRVRTSGAGRAPWGTSAIGVVTPHVAEARAFVGLTAHFRERGIPVPQVYAYDPGAGLYLMEDLGDVTLAECLRLWRVEGESRAGRPAAAVGAALRGLAALQVRGARGFDRSLCFDGAELDGEAFRADLQLFLTHYVPRFVLRPGPDAHVQADMERLIRRVDAIPREHVCHRDFQTRNIMWVRDAPVFIDYQGARFGPLAYDLASFLYSPDTGLSEPERGAALATYLHAVADEGVALDRIDFERDLYAVVLVRRLQALGAYARIAATENKPDYLAKIPPALATLNELFRSGRLSLGLPALERWLSAALSPDETVAH